MYFPKKSKLSANVVTPSIRLQIKNPPVQIVMKNQATERNFIEISSSIPSADTGFAGVVVKKELICVGNTINSYDASGSMGYHNTIDLIKGEFFKDTMKKFDGIEF